MSCRSRSPSRATLSITLVLTALVGALVFCGPALAAPLFSVTPAQGATVNSPDVSIHAVVTDSAALRLYARLSVDGGTRFASPVLSPDKKTLTLDAVFPRLKNGNHSASLWVMGASGAVYRKDWSFSVSAPPLISATVPADGSQTDSLKPTVAAIVTGNGTPISAATLAIDGSVVPAVWDPSTGSISWAADNRFADEGVYTALVTATDAGGRISSSTWSFTTHTLPGMAAVCTRCHSTYPAAHPMTYTCATCHYRFYAPMGGTCNDCHSGHGADHLSRVSCAVCHTSKTDPAWAAGKAPDHATDFPDFAKCTLCHETQLTREHGRYKSTSGAPYDCDLCHGATTPAPTAAAVLAGQTGCGACHPEAETSDPHSALHEAKDFEPGCVREHCHSSGNVVAEHTRQIAELNTHPDTSYDDPCEICHEGKGADCMGGTDDRDCTTCHTKHGDPDALHLASDAGGCWCHGGADVSVVHSYNCDLCHANDTVPAVRNSDCRACHFSSGAM